MISMPGTFESPFTRRPSNCAYTSSVPSRGEGVLGPGPGRAAGSIAGLPGQGKSPGPGGALGAVACRGLKARNRDEPGDTKAAGKRLRRSRRKSFPHRTACENRSSGARATTPKLYTQAGVGDGVRHGPGRDRPWLRRFPTPVHSGRAMPCGVFPSEGWADDTGGQNILCKGPLSCKGRLSFWRKDT